MESRASRVEEIVRERNGRVHEIHLVHLDDIEMIETMKLSDLR
jgi:hypothetical protein